MFLCVRACVRACVCQRGTPAKPPPCQTRSNSHEKLMVLPSKLEEKVPHTPHDLQVIKYACIIGLLPLGKITTVFSTPPPQLRTGYSYKGILVETFVGFLYPYRFLSIPMVGHWEISCPEVMDRIVL